MSRTRRLSRSHSRGCGISKARTFPNFPLACMRKYLINPPLYFRYHIGESLLPSVRHHLRFIGADDKVDSFGFFKKVGLVYMLPGTAHYHPRMLSPVRRLNLINSSRRLVSFCSLSIATDSKAILRHGFLGYGTQQLFLECCAFAYNQPPAYRLQYLQCRLALSLTKYFSIMQRPRAFRCSSLPKLHHLTFPENAQSQPSGPTGHPRRAGPSHSTTLLTPVDEQDWYQIATLRIADSTRA
jgi:hypothetical protein